MTLLTQVPVTFLRYSISAAAFINGSVILLKEEQTKGVLAAVRLMAGQTEW